VGVWPGTGRLIAGGRCGVWPERPGSPAHKKWPGFWPSAPGGPARGPHPCIVAGGVMRPARGACTPRSCTSCWSTEPWRGRDRGLADCTECGCCGYACRPHPASAGPGRGNKRGPRERFARGFVRLPPAPTCTRAHHPGIMLSAPPAGPAAAWGVLVLGPGTLSVLAVAVGTSLFSELAIAGLAWRRFSLQDGSALPPECWWCSAAASVPLFVPAAAAVFGGGGEAHFRRPGTQLAEPGAGRRSL